MSRARLLLPAAMAGALLGAPAVAGEWTKSAGLGVGTYYSDNICLSGVDKQGQWVGTARPDVSLQGRGGRASMNLRAGVELNTLGESNIECVGGRGRNLGNRESVVPRVSFNGDMELIENWLTLEANAMAAQNPVNPFAAGGDDAINGVDNTNLTYQYGAGARSQRRIGDRGIFSARYNYNEQYNSVRLIGNSTQHSAQASLGTDPAAARLSVGINGSYRKIEFDDSPQGPAFSPEFATVTANARLRLSRSFALDATVGEEFNDFISLSDEIDGTFWDAGFTWTPNPRVSVAAGYGERFFGSTPRLNINYRHKRSTFNLSYLRSINLPRDIRGRFNQQVQDLPPDAQDLLPDIEDLPGDPLAGNGGNTFIGRGPIQNETLSLSWGFQARRTGVGLNASESLQTQFATGNSATFRNVSLTLTRRLGPSMSADARLGWNKREGDDEGFGIGIGGFGQNLETWTAGLGLSRTLGNSTTLTLRYQYRDMSSDNAFNTFTENRVNLNVRYQF